MATLVIHVFFLIGILFANTVQSAVPDPALATCLTKVQVCSWLLLCSDVNAKRFHCQQKAINDRVMAQVKLLNDQVCNQSTQKTLKLGSDPKDWDAINLINRIILGDDGEYPGVLFEGPGLVEPARPILVKIIDAFGKAGKASNLTICAPDDQTKLESSFKTILSANFAAAAADVKANNCQSGLKLFQMGDPDLMEKVSQVLKDEKDVISAKVTTKDRATGAIALITKFFNFAKPLPGM